MLVMVGGGGELFTQYFKLRVPFHLSHRVLGMAFETTALVHTSIFAPASEDVLLRVRDITPVCVKRLEIEVYVL
jgi:hypothetical protein